MTAVADPGCAGGVDEVGETEGIGLQALERACGVGRGEGRLKRGPGCRLLRGVELAGGRGDQDATLIGEEPRLAGDASGDPKRASQAGGNGLVGIAQDGAVRPAADQSLALAPEAVGEVQFRTTRGPVGPLRRLLHRGDGPECRGEPLRIDGADRDDGICDRRGERRIGGAEWRHEASCALLGGTVGGAIEEDFDLQLVDRALGVAAPGPTDVESAAAVEPGSRLVGGLRRPVCRHGRRGLNVRLLVAAGGKECAYEAAGKRAPASPHGAVGQWLFFEPIGSMVTVRVRPSGCGGPADSATSLMA